MTSDEFKEAVMELDEQGFSVRDIAVKLNKLECSVREKLFIIKSREMNKVIDPFAAIDKRKRGH